MPEQQHIDKIPGEIRTIEGKILECMMSIGLIEGSDTDPCHETDVSDRKRQKVLPKGDDDRCPYFRKHVISRSGRTDKGVHAAMNVISMQLLCDEKTKADGAKDEVD